MFNFYRVYCKYFGCYAAILLILYAIDAWPLKVTNNWTFESSLADLESNLKWMHCSVDYGTAIYDIQTPNGCGGYTYGYIFARTMGFFGVNESLGGEFRFFFAIMLLTILSIYSVYLEKQFKFKSSIIILILSSPPVWLSMIHGSLDIPVIFILTTAWLVDKKSPIMSFLLVAVASLIKLFTIGLLFYLGLRIIKYDSSRSRKLTVFLTLLFVSLNISFDYSRVDWSDPSYRIASGIFFVFGIESSINWILVIVEKLTVYTVFLTTLQVKVLAFAFFFAALYLLLLFRNKLIRFDSQSLQFSARQNFDFTFHFLPFFVLFFQGQNWDNKLIFFFVPGIIIANVLPTLIRLPMLLCTFYLTDIWPLSKDFAIFEITQLLGDLCVYALVIFGSIFLTLSYTNLISRRIGLSLKVLFR